MYLFENICKASPDSFPLVNYEYYHTRGALATFQYTYEAVPPLFNKLRYRVLIERHMDVNCVD